MLKPFSFSNKNLIFVEKKTFLDRKATSSPYCLDIVGITAHWSRPIVGKFAEVVVGQPCYEPAFMTWKLITGRMTRIVFLKVIHAVEMYVVCIVLYA